MTATSSASARGHPLVDLDRPETYAAVDVADMRGHLEALPTQIEDAWRLVAAFEAPAACAGADAIVVAGMGGSAIGADLVRGLYIDTLPVPLVVWRDYGLPAWVGPRTLVIAASYSGETEETLSAVERARAVGARLLGITTGGALAEVLTAYGAPLLRYHYAAQPRAALGYSLGLLLGVLARLGYLPPQDTAVEAGVWVAREALARFGPGVPTAANGAKQLARALVDRIAVVYGAGFLAPVARRWKGQCNENAKHWAFFEELPELDHNAVMGYAFPPALADRLLVVLLRSSLLGPRLALRGAVTLELLERAGIPRWPADAWGDGPLAHLLSALVYGDWTSYYLALLNGTDPTSIAAIDYLKARLAEGG
jgi:glucose/mannose-6-phosphate isomerase